MKAEVTAENKPAYDRVSMPTSECDTELTKMRCVEILLILLHKLLVVLLGLPAVVSMKFGSRILLSGR